MSGEALVAPVQVLVELTQRLTVDRIRPRTSNGGSIPNSPVITTTSSRIQLPYDPSAVLLLEILTSIVAKARPAIHELWCVSHLVFVSSRQALIP